MKTNNSKSVTNTALLLAILAPITYFSYSGSDPVDTGSMLDVSVSIRTISHVSIDKYGDSVWAPGTGSGFLVSTNTCEVWTNQHVIENAAVIEIFPRGWKKCVASPRPLSIQHRTPILPYYRWKAVTECKRHDLAVRRLPALAMKPTWSATLSVVTQILSAVG